MSKSPRACPKCGHRFPEGTPDPSWCPGCGELCSGLEVVEPAPLPPPPDFEAFQTPAERRRWRLCFWLCFLLTPPAVLVTVVLPNLFRSVAPGFAGQFLRLLAPAGVLGTFALGALGAGFCLAKLHAKPRTTAGLIGATVAFAVGLAVVYVGILFVGCLVLVERTKLFQF
jgi:hypothetical protein